MANESSIAPKERVNIVYKSTSEGAQREVELPLKIVMMGDYTLKRDDRPLDHEDRKPKDIDKNNFNDVMKGQKLGLTLNVPNKLAEKEGEDISVNLKIETLKDFEPESIIKQVPELNKLLELRTALRALKDPLGNLPAFRKKIEAILGDEASRERLLKELEAK